LGKIESIISVKLVLLNYENDLIRDFKPAIV